MSRESVSEAPPVVQQELGTLEVAPRVFQEIAARAAQEVPGVAAVSRPSSGLFRRGHPRQAVRVERGQAEVALSMSVTVSYDVNIPSLAVELRRRVTEAIEGATGYRVRVVNLAVEHIAPPGPEGRGQASPEGGNVPESPPVPDQE